MENLQINYHNERFHPPTGVTETFEQQYSPLYALRIRQLRPLLIERMANRWGVNKHIVLPKILSLINSAQEEGHLSSVKYVVGCIYKDTPTRPSFLKDYTKFVIPSSLEVETREDGDLAEILTGLDETGNFDEAEKRLTEIIQHGGVEKCFSNNEPASQTSSEAIKYLNNLQKKEKLWFEDESGRVEVDSQTSVFATTTINKLEMVSGMVIGAEGKLISGKFSISRWMFTGLDDIEETSAATENTPTNQSDRYIAFLSTLDCEELNEKGESEAKFVKRGSQFHASSTDYYRAQLHMLFNKKAKDENTNCEAKGKSIQAICENVEFLVICGGLIPDLEGINVDTNTKLSAFEMAQKKSQIRLDSDDTIRKREKTAMNMQAADSFISNFIDQSGISAKNNRRLCVMPSQREPSNHFYPQQPILPFCLPQTSFKMKDTSHGWKVDFGTNPIHIGIQGTSNAPGASKELTIIGTSGENIQDCMRYSHNLIPEIDWIERTLLCRHICPTAPDTLPCFPYRVKGAKRFGQIHLPTNMGEGGVTSDPFCLIKESIGNDKSAPDVLFAGACKTFATRYLPTVKRRLIAVPNFSKTHSFCIMNISSPKLDTFEIRLTENIPSTETDASVELA